MSTKEREGEQLSKKLNENEKRYSKLCEELEYRTLLLSEKDAQISQVSEQLQTVNAEQTAHLNIVNESDKLLKAENEHLKLLLNAKNESNVTIMAKLSEEKEELEKNLRNLNKELA